MEPVTHGITLDAVARFVDIATDALSEAREEIDALNVYPVPDGDTGTNMFLTVSAARDELGAARAADPDLGLEEGMALLARAALMGARGNSGVILSQMLRAYVTHLAGASSMLGDATDRVPLRDFWPAPVSDTILRLPGPPGLPSLSYVN